MVKTAVVMLSGGLDSTYCLHHYLSTTLYNVHAHHVSYRIAREPRWPFEDEATEKIIRYFLREYAGRLTFSMSRYDFDLPYYGYDGNALTTIGAAVCLNMPTPCFLVDGTCPEDLEDPDVAHRHQVGICQTIFSACLNGSRSHRKTGIQDRLEFPLIDHNLTKKTMLDALPPALHPVIWSCRTPNKSPDHLSQCGLCRSCVKMQTVLGNTVKNSGAAAPAEMAMPSKVMA